MTTLKNRVAKLEAQAKGQPVPDLEAIRKWQAYEQHRFYILMGVQDGPLDPYIPPPAGYEVLYPPASVEEIRRGLNELMGIETSED
jgi:hypothetical protein